MLLLILRYTEILWWKFCTWRAISGCPVTNKLELTFLVIYGMRQFWCKFDAISSTLFFFCSSHDSSTFSFIFIDSDISRAFLGRPVHTSNPWSCPHGWCRLGKFSEYVPPDVQKTHSLVLPSLRFCLLETI